MPPDRDAVDEVIPVAREWGMNPRIPLSLMLVESAGLRRSVVFVEDGVEFRAFPGGDVAERLDGQGRGPHSFGSCQVLADVHGPWLEPPQFTTRPIWIFPAGRRIPDYPAASAKWDSIRTSMAYLAVHGPNGGWLKVWQHGGLRLDGRRVFGGGNAAFEADPLQWLVDHVPLMQGSIAWDRHHAIAAYPVADQAVREWQERQHPTPPPPPVKDYRTLYVEELRGIRRLAADTLLDAAIWTQTAEEKLRAEGAL
jgi:hypothetical protein